MATIDNLTSTATPNYDDSRSEKRVRGENEGRKEVINE